MIWEFEEQVLDIPGTVTVGFLEVKMKVLKESGGWLSKRKSG